MEQKSKKPKKDPEQIQKELQTLEDIVDNPLNALPVFGPFKRFRRYFVVDVLRNINNEIRHTLGAKMLNAIFDCDELLPRCQFGTRKGKLEATEEFLHKFGFLLSAVEFLAMTPNMGVSIRQATELVMNIKEIRRQMHGFEKYLSRTEIEEYRRNLQPKGEESEQV